MSEDAHNSDNNGYLFDPKMILRALFTLSMGTKWQWVIEDDETVMLKDLFFLQEMRVAPVKFTPEGRIEVSPLEWMTLEQ